MVVPHAAAMHGRRGRRRRRRSGFRPAVLAALVCQLIAGSFTAVSTAASTPTQQERDGTSPGALALHNQRFIRGGPPSQVEGNGN
ncbi:unnamed protein product, partial [Ectocarpus sp. 8 AP-2014]